MSRILVCIDGHPKSHLLIDFASRKARATGDDLQILNVVGTTPTQPSKAGSQRLISLLQKASEDGAEIVQVSSSDATRAIVDHIEAAHAGGIEFSSVVAGTTGAAPLRRFFSRPLSSEIARRFAGAFEMTFIPIGAPAAAPPDWKSFFTDGLTLPNLFQAIFAVIIAALAALAVAALLPAQPAWLAGQSAVALLLLAAVFSAFRAGPIPAVLIALAATPLVDYFILRPRMELNLGTLDDLVNLGLLLLGGLLGTIAGRGLRRTERLAAQSEARTQALNSLLTTTAEASTRAELLEMLDLELEDLLASEVAVLTPKHGAAAPDAECPIFDVFPQTVMLDEAQRQLACACWEQDQATGFATPYEKEAGWRFELMSTPTRKLGVLAVQVPEGMRADISFLDLVASLADQIAIQLAHTDLLSEQHRSRFETEREQLRALLLSSVSHDLKTPLASVIGGLKTMSSLRRRGRLTNEAALELEETALHEAERLDSFITNILSMTQLDRGDVSFKLSPCDPTEPLSVARRALRFRLKGRRVSVSKNGEPQDIMTDPMLTAQILQNLLDNAVKYSPDGAPIDIALSWSGDGFSYAVRDHGKGIPDDQLDRIFDKHERLQYADSRVAGTGLGLAIVKGVMTGLGGTVTARNVDGGGAEFELFFPREA